MSMVQAEFRKVRAVELAMQGMSYDAIASELGYANRGTAWRVVSKALSERIDGAVEEYRHVELARLDALQAALWDQAMTGDTRSADAILRIIDRRIRLLGLDQATVKGDFPRTVVVDPADLVRWGIEATREATPGLD
jgi:orotate phosphoribosyltransferase-like protein